jgi:diguanylate cyclase (GGDEF)-like protein
VNDVRRDFRFNISSSDERPLGSVIACPLIVSQSAEGLIRLDSRNIGCYAQDDLRFLDIFLGLVNTAVANAKLFAQTQQLALTDGLTGLYRRQPFMDQLDRELARSIRTREPLSVLMLDIDDFKKYNDNFGHTAGDLMLRSVSEIMRSSVSADSMCARYGGEEFSVFLPKMSKEQALQVANRMRQSVEEKVRGAVHGSGKPVTVSIGLASFPDDAQSDLELIRRSDQRLYQAKKQGKNRVCSL